MSNNNFQNRVKENVDDVLPVVSSALGQILNKEFDISVSYDEQKEVRPLLDAEGYPLVAVTFNSGQNLKVVSNVLLFPQEFVVNFYAWMLMDEPAEEISDEHFDGLKEGMEQVFGQIKMAVSDDNGTFTFENLSVALANEVNDLQTYILGREGARCSYTLNTEGASFKINHYFWPENADQFLKQGDTAMPQTQESAMPASNPVDIHNAKFGDLPVSGGDTGAINHNVDMLLDVELEIRVEIDRKRILVSDLLKLGKGSIVEMEKSAGEALDVFVNGRKFAEGEVVVVDDRFGIRITQLLSPKDRVKSLGHAF